MALALRKQGAPAELADMLWPEADGDRARTLLKVYVHRVRRRVGRDFIVSENGRYHLGAALIDVDLIESNLALVDREAALALAFRLYKPKPVETIRWSWFEAYAQRFNWVARDFAIRSARDAMANGEDEIALSIARGLTRVDPCDEEATEIVISTLLKRYEHGAAFEEYRRCTIAMRSEFGIEPSSRLRGHFITEAAVTHVV